MKSHLLDLFRYDAWANQRMLQAVLTAGLEDEKITFWLGHIIFAEEIWLDRMQKGHTPLSPTQQLPLSQCQTRMLNIHQKIMEWLSSLSEQALQEGVSSYQNSQGEAFQTPWIGILTHVVNHSTHHRAQVAARFRELGHTPPPTDYIFYLRQGGSGEV